MENTTTSGRWVEKRDDNARGRTLHGLCADGFPMMKVQLNSVLSWANEQPAPLRVERDRADIES
jgi:hypothetical protein